MSEAAAAPAPWDEALLLASLLAVDPVGLGGVSLRAHAGPVRDAWLAQFRRLLPEGAPWLRMPASVGDAALLGGLDLAGTLQAGRPVSERGLLARADGGIVVLAMAERFPGGTAARLTAAMDTGVVVTARDGLAVAAPAGFGTIALDEGEPDEDAPAPALLDRLAFLLDLSPIGVRETGSPGIDAQNVATARVLYPAVRADDQCTETLCGSAMALGIVPLRPCLMAVRAARAHAALRGRLDVTIEDAAVAARLVLSPRATRVPQEPAPSPEPPPPKPSEDADGSTPPSNEADRESENDGAPPADVVLEAAKAAIPADLMARLGKPATQRMRKQSTGKMGAATKGLRGRPAGVREAAPRDGERLDLVETLRAAAPWQALRRRETGTLDAGRILVRGRDFRVTKLEQRARTTTIFVVDASGSSAFNRLAEAKGAVELLLADCYRRRDEVAVLSFRGRGVTLLLPPTRSLVRAKRSLAGLPGGGPTPLAAGIQAGASLAEAVRRGGFTPALVFLTDGSGNIALDGSAGRAKAGEDARQACRRLKAAGLRAVLVDTSPRAQPAARVLADQMGALYLPLPYADAAGLSRRVKAAVAAQA